MRLVTEFEYCTLYGISDTAGSTWLGKGSLYDAKVGKRSATKLSKMADEFESFLGELGSFLSTLEEVTTSQSIAESTVYRIEAYLEDVNAVVGALEVEDDQDEDARQLVELLSDLAEELQKVLLRWVDIELGIDPEAPHIGLKVEKEVSGRRGRPKYVLKREQLLFLRDLSFSWSKIAVMYGISRRTLITFVLKLVWLDLTMIISPQLVMMSLKVSSGKSRL